MSRPIEPERLIDLLRQLPDGVRVAGNQIGNLMVLRYPEGEDYRPGGDYSNAEYLGFIDFNDAEILLESDDEG